jgi:DNA-directed RNA polymerase subunit H (RpoH/RPB5)
METLDYDVKDYQIFSINEIDAMHNNSQLDILLRHKTEDKKVYIKYYVSSKNSSKQIRPPTLDTIIEDLYEIDNVLTPKDTLVIIIDEEPNETIMNKVKYVYERNQVYVVIHNIKRLQFNLLEHSLIPKVSILTEKEKEDLKKEYALKDLDQLPEICRFDPLALAIMLRPNEIVKLIRNSATALTTPYYRVCV